MYKCASAVRSAYARARENFCKNIFNSKHKLIYTFFGNEQKCKKVSLYEIPFCVWNIEN